MLVGVEHMNSPLPPIAEELRAQIERALNAGDLSLAESLNRRVLVHFPDNPTFWLMLGSTLSYRGVVEEAQRALERSAQLDPCSAEPLNWLAMILLRSGKPDEALKLAENALELAPDSPVALFNLGMACLQLADSKRARDLFARARSILPDNPHYHFYYGEASEELGLLHEAREGYSRAAKVAPELLPALLALANVCRKLYDFQEAYEWAAKALKIDPNLAQAHVFAGHSAMRLLRIQQARTHFEHAMAIDSGSVAARAKLAETYQCEGNFEEARRLLEDVMTMFPRAGDAFAQYVDFTKISDDHRPLLNQMVKLANDPEEGLMDRSLIHLALGKSFNDLGELDMAMGHFEEGHRLQLEAPGPKFDGAGHVKEWDQVIDTLDRDFLLNSAGMEHPCEPIFIVGMMRSGTTLMAQILSSHPDVGAAGEQSFWLNNAGSAVDWNSKRPLRDKASELADTYSRLLAEVAGDHPHIIDKHPYNLLFAGLLLSIFPNSRIIHMRRHPVDVALSIWMTRTDHPPLYANRKEDIVIFYRQYEKLTKHWRKLLPADRYTEVRYEELVVKQEAVIRGVLDFCGLSWDPVCLEHERNQRLVNTPSLWQVRQPMYKSSVDRWRRYEKWLGPLQDLQEYAETAPCAYGC